MTGGPYAGIRKDRVVAEPINLQSITDFSGIPRETVRRKLRDLMELGWIERDERGNFIATPKAATDLEPLVKISGYLAKMRAIFSPERSVRAANLATPCTMAVCLRAVNENPPGASDVEQRV